MMANFIKCSVDSIEYFGKEKINPPINLDRIIYFVKGNESYYPDNTGVPSIRFIYDKDLEVIWWYHRHEEMRDEDYKRIEKIALGI